MFEFLKRFNVFAGFKNFIFRGNVVDLATGVVIGAAFTTVINALVKDLLTPFIGLVAHVPDFSNFVIRIDGSTFPVGDLLNATISFFLVAMAIYFFVIWPMHTVHERIKRRRRHDPTTKVCPECLSEIPIAAKRCSRCTQIVK